MNLGIMHMSADESVDQFVAAVKLYEAEGFASVWVPNIFGIDAITALDAPVTTVVGGHGGGGPLADVGVGPIEELHAFLAQFG